MIKWITENIGTGAYEDVSGQPDIHIVDVRDMVDKKGNLGTVAEEKIQEAILHLSKQEKVVICCDYGLSRSNAIAAGVLATSLHRPFNEAVRKVMKATGEKGMKIEVLSAVRQAIEKDSDSVARIDDSSKHILVTGGSGTIGKTLIPKIQTQHEIIAPERGAIDIFKGSVDLDLMVKEQGIDTIVHLANPRIYTSNQAMGETVVMLRNVLDVCQENNVKLVYPSSWEIYSGYRSHFLLASEVLPPVPKGPYGETKYLCEILLDQYRRRYGLDYVIVRSSPVYGAGDKPKFIHNFMQKAIHNEEITAHKYLNGFPSLDLLYIDDVISAIAAVLEGNHDGAFNIGGGKGISTTEVAHLLVKIAGTNSPIKHREINDFVSNIVMDTSRARTELDWYPRISIQDGLSRLFSDFCQESQ